MYSSLTNLNERTFKYFFENIREKTFINGEIFNFTQLSQYVDMSEKNIRK